MSQLGGAVRKRAAGVPEARVGRQLGFQHPIAAARLPHRGQQPLAHGLGCELSEDEALFTDTDSVMVQIFKLQDPLHAMAEANLDGATPLRRAGKPKDPKRNLRRSLQRRAPSLEVMGQLGKLGNETFPARILEYVACAPRCTASQVPGGARGRQQAQGGLRAEKRGRLRGFGLSKAGSAASV